jgi:hypothetical protein
MELRPRMLPRLVGAIRPQPGRDFARSGIDGVAPAVGGGREEQIIIGKLMNKPDYAKGVADFLEKRSPRFAGDAAPRQDTAREQE